MIRDLVIGYWPLWLLLFCGAIMALAVSRAAMLGDRELHRSLSERQAQDAVRPSPAPIDVEPMA